MSNYISRKDKDTVAERANFCCEYCFTQLNYSSDSFSIEHIIPLVKGGTNDLDNLAFSCQGCNNRKYIKTEARDELTGQFVSLYHPRLDKWHKHFKWSNDKLLILGITAKGRVTIKALDLNRFGVVNLRGLLMLIDEHPPHHIKS